MILVKKVFKKGQKRVKKGSKKGQKWPILGHFWGPFLTYFWVNEAWEKSMILGKKVIKKVEKNHLFNTFLTLFLTKMDTLKLPRFGIFEHPLFLSLFEPLLLVCSILPFC